MRVLVDARGLLEEVKAGVEGYTLQMLKYLKRIYPNDEYILFSYSWKKKPEPNLVAGCEWVHKKWPNILASLSWRFLEWPKADYFVENCDWVWFPNIRFMPVGKSIKKVVTVHDLSFELVPECYRTQSRWWHWYMNIKNNLKKMDLIVTVSENSANDVADVYQIEKNKIRWHYPGVEKNLCDSLEANKSFYPGEYFLHLGTLEKRKNVDNLIEAYISWKKKKTAKGLEIEKIPDLVLAGGQGWSMSKLIREVVDTDPKINYLGYVDENIRQQLYANCRALFYVSHYEGFGFPPLEAMKMGVPIVSSFSGSLGEVVSDNAIMLDSNSIFSLEKSFELVWQNQIETIEESKNFVWEKYDWEKAAVFFHQQLESKLIDN